MSVPDPKYKIGDIVVLREVKAIYKGPSDLIQTSYTGRSCCLAIKYIYDGSIGGLLPNFCFLLVIDF